MYIMIATYSSNFIFLKPKNGITFYYSLDLRWTWSRLGIYIYSGQTLFTLHGTIPGVPQERLFSLNECIGLLYVFPKLKKAQPVLGEYPALQSREASDDYEYINKKYTTLLVLRKGIVS